MARYTKEWDDLGRNIQDVVDRAINSSDYQKLNQTIRQVVDRAADLGSEAVRMVREAGEQKKNLPVLYASTGKKTTKGVLKTVGGGVISAITAIGLLSSVFMDMMFGGFGVLTTFEGFALVGLAGGIWLTCSGVSIMGKVKRFKAYRNALGEKTHCALEKLAQSVGKSVKFVRKELWQMIDEGLFLEGHMDKEQTCLITSHETYRHYEQSRLQLEQRQRREAEEKARQAADPRDPRVQEVLDRGNAFIGQIRRCNDAIPGEEISAKIDRMETIVRRIFARAEEHPEIVPDLKKLMDYYLPMTVKLLNAYADMDAQPIQGETIQSSKREIEDTLDTLNLAFEKLLDDLFRDTAVDVSSDISVLNTLLAQEGLTEDELTKMKKQNIG